MLRNLLSNQLVRFLLVGGVNTAFGYGIFTILVLLSVAPGVALLIATALGAYSTI